MTFFRNAEIKRGIIIFAFISVLFTVFGFFESVKCGVLVLLCTACLFVFYLISTKKRYSKIIGFTEEINNVLHGENVLMLDSFTEGEISILAGEVKKLFAKLREQNEKLSKEKLVLSDSLADISHQIRTPLTSINIILTLLGAPDLSEERRFELIGELMTLLSATEKLVTMLLKIAKIDACAVEFAQKEVKVSDLLKNAVSVVEIALEIKNQKLEVVVSDESFNGDFDWTSEAVSNILKNCMEHTPENGTVKIETEETPIYTKIKISDTGGGINEKDLPHLFERFYKGSNSSSNNFGIGLNLAFLIVSGQNGTLKAYNENGGACFEMKFYKAVV